MDAVTGREREPVRRGPLVGRLVEQLRARGRLPDSAWAEALAAVPRDLFVPAAAWAMPDEEGADGYRIDIAADPAAWWRAVYSDTSLVIQADDGAGDPTDGRGLFSSSVSAPGVVLAFLDLLEVEPGHRVLEIGTGSGWTAALVSWRAGERFVTSVEIDTHLAERAAAALASAGVQPGLLVGDGTAGHREGAPYDRIHVTAAVAEIPGAWIAQARPGGVIVAPFSPSGGPGVRLRLTVVDEGTAVGSFHGPASYMMLRAQRRGTTWSSHHADEAAVTATRLDPRAIAGASLGARLVIAACAPHVGWHTATDDVGALSLLLFDTGDPAGSWAAADHESGAAEFTVTQYGPRRLFDEAADAYLRWCSLGRPDYRRLGLTVTADSSGATAPTLWCDHPSHVIAASHV